MKEKEIVHTAIENLEPGFLKGQWHGYKNALRDNGIDGTFTLEVEGRKETFDAVVKKELRTYLVDQIINKAKGREHFIVIVHKLFPALKEKLREHNINYLEANGNIFINTRKLFLLLDTDKTLKPEKKTGNRAFTPTGLKVLFEFLRDKELINQTQRVIAERAAVALGNIPKVIQGLKEANQIYKLNQKQYTFNDRKDLLHVWAKEYQNTLKPTLYIGAFTLKRFGNNWKEVPLNRMKTVWGGEPAADLITNYLQPGKLTLYTEEEKKELMVHYGLMPDKEGNVHVYEKFWADTIELETAPQILVYADLINTNDKRCLETANILFNEHIEPKL
jgi:hypothetical protein